MPNGPDLLLINAGGTRKKIYQDLSKVFSGMEPPSWVALTAGFVRRNGYSVDILDANVLGLDSKETAERVKQINPRLTGILVYGQQANTSTPTMVGVSAAAKEIKSSEPERPLIISGWHPSALPERTLREEACDYVAEGEGFYTYLGLLQEKPKTHVPGLWWRADEHTIAHNPRAPTIKNLTEEAGEIAWDLLPMKQGIYRAYNWHALADLETRTKYASFFTGFGCPFKCNFCAIHSTFGERKMRYWSPDWVLGQIDHLVEKYGVKHLKLNDELFVLNPGHFMPIVDGLIDRNYGLNLTAFARVDITDRVDLARFKKAGFNWFQFGIESGSPGVLDAAHKGDYRREDIKRVVRKIHDNGIDLCANFIFGLPEDTKESMQETLDLAIELNSAFPSFFAAMAPPGSDLYNQALQNGTALPESWDGYAQQGYNFLPLRNKNLTAAEILAFRDHAFDTYFTRPDYLAMIERRFGKFPREHIEGMCKVKLKRKILGD